MSLGTPISLPPSLRKRGPPRKENPHRRTPRDVVFFRSKSPSIHVRTIAAFISRQSTSGRSPYCCFQTVHWLAERWNVTVSWPSPCLSNTKEFVDLHGVRRVRPQDGRSRIRPQPPTRKEIVEGSSFIGSSRFPMNLVEQCARLASKLACGHSEGDANHAAGHGPKNADPLENNRLVPRCFPGRNRRSPAPRQSRHRHPRAAPTDGLRDQIHRGSRVVDVGNFIKLHAGLRVHVAGVKRVPDLRDRLAHLPVLRITERDQATGVDRYCAGPPRAPIAPALVAPTVCTGRPRCGTVAPGKDVLDFLDVDVPATRATRTRRPAAGARCRGILSSCFWNSSAGHLHAPARTTRIFRCPTALGRDRRALDGNIWPSANHDRGRQWHGSIHDVLIRNPAGP